MDAAKVPPAPGSRAIATRPSRGATIRTRATRREYGHESSDRPRPFTPQEGRDILKKLRRQREADRVRSVANSEMDDPVDLSRGDHPSTGGNDMTLASPMVSATIENFVSQAQEWGSRRGSEENRLSRVEQERIDHEQTRVITVAGLTPPQTEPLRIDYEQGPCASSNSKKCSPSAIPHSRPSIIGTQFGIRRSMGARSVTTPSMRARSSTFLQVVASPFDLLPRRGSLDTSRRATR